MNPVGSNDQMDSTLKAELPTEDVCLDMGSNAGSLTSLLEICQENQSVISDDRDGNSSPPPPYTRPVDISAFDPNIQDSDVYNKLLEWWNITTQANGISDTNITNTPQALLMLLLLVFTLSHRVEETRYTTLKKIRRLFFLMATLSIVIIVYVISSLIYMHTHGM
ncbi:protein E31A [Elephant endotheliotropic herpesvirus 6]|nr:protein E31A [Elephant endotheliotropic herpesvirus 6]